MAEATDMLSASGLRRAQRRVGGVLSVMPRITIKTSFWPLSSISAL